MENQTKGIVSSPKETRVLSDVTLANEENKNKTKKSCDLRIDPFGKSLNIKECSVKLIQRHPEVQKDHIDIDHRQYKCDKCEYAAYGKHD